MRPRVLVTLALAACAAAALIATGGNLANLDGDASPTWTIPAIEDRLAAGEPSTRPGPQAADVVEADALSPTVTPSKGIPVRRDGGRSRVPRRSNVGCPESNTPVTPALATPGAGRAGSVRTTGTAAVALTFDDGPDPVNTPKILDLLKSCNVKATFCVVGHRARDNPDLIRRIFNEGHTLCNHSWQHLIDLGATSRTDDYIRGDLSKTNKYIHIAVPEAPIKYFRAPGGNFTTRLIAIAAELGMTSIEWSVDPKDWDSTHYGSGKAMVDHVVSFVFSTTKPGAIVLSHDNLKPDTISAYAILLPLLAHFYTLIPLPT